MSIGMTVLHPELRTCGGLLGRSSFVFPIAVRNTGLLLLTGEAAFDWKLVCRALGHARHTASPDSRCAKSQWQRRRCLSGCCGDSARQTSGIRHIGFMARILFLVRLGNQRPSRGRAAARTWRASAESWPDAQGDKCFGACAVGAAAARGLKARARCVTSRVGPRAAFLTRRNLLAQRLCDAVGA